MRTLSVLDQRSVCDSFGSEVVQPVPNKCQSRKGPRLGLDNKGMIRNANVSKYRRDALKNTNRHPVFSAMPQIFIQTQIQIPNTNMNTHANSLEAALLPRFVEDDCERLLRKALISCLSTYVKPIKLFFSNMKVKYNLCNHEKNYCITQNSLQQIPNWSLRAFSSGTLSCVCMRGVVRRLR